MIINNVLVYRPKIVMVETVWSIVISEKSILEIDGRLMEVVSVTGTTLYS